MACWNLKEETGECLKTGNTCNDNEWNCPIAQYERRDTFARSRSKKTYYDLEKKADSGNPEAMYEIANLLIDEAIALGKSISGKIMSSGIDWMKEAAKNGHATAQAFLRDSNISW